MNTEILYSMDNFPVSQNRVYENETEAKACPRGDINLIVDPVTGVICNISFKQSDLVYDEHYQNEQGHSRIFQEHLEQVASIVGDKFKGKKILEIGCGKGSFLELMRRRGHDVIGVDPAYEGNSPYVVKKPFSPILGLSGDAIILRHVLEHIPNPLGFLSSIFEANCGRGLIYIETPCLDWICNHKAWFDIYYEHVNYFRLSDFYRMFDKVLESGRLFGDQYLYVIADLSSLRKKPLKDKQVFMMPPDFLDGIDRLIELMKTQRNKNRKNIIWGAASKGVIFTLIIIRRGNIYPDLVVDINPAKQGKYMPITGLPIMAPGEALKDVRDGDAIFVMNSNYYEEIKSMAGNNMIFYRIDRNELF